jgi:hypothetical protein
MRSPHRPTTLLLALLLCAAPAAWSQGTSASASAKSSTTPVTDAAAGGPELRTERIRLEDDSARIDELRIGGQTRSISVTPKGGMPAYDVAPKTGERTWKVLGF